MKENEQVEATTSDFGICPDPDLEGFQQNIDNDVRSKQAEYIHILCFDKFWCCHSIKLLHIPYERDRNNFKIQILFNQVSIEESVETFGFDEEMSESIRQSQSGFGESLLHLEGKRDKDKAFDEQRRRDNKRSNREAASSSETVSGQESLR